MKQGWNNNKLGKLCEIYNGNSINAEYKKEHFLGATEGYPFIATKDVSPLGIIDYDNGVRIPNFNDYKIAYPNSVFICAEGGSAGKKFAFVEQNVCFGNKLFCISPKNETLHGRFIYYFIQSQRFREQFYSLLSGLIGGVSAKKFKDITIEYPSKKEQERIVERLDAAFAQIDELKSNAEKQLAEARALFQSALTQAMQPKPGWQVFSFSQLIKLKSGDNLPAKSFVEGEYPVYGGNGIAGYHNQYNKEGGQIVIGRVGALCGNVRFIESPFWLTDNGFEVILDKEHKMDLPFLTYLLNFCNLRQYARQAAQPVISNVSLKDIQLNIPPVSEQQIIVEHLDALSNHVKELEEISRKTAAECDAFKQALLRQIFE